LPLGVSYGFDEGLRVAGIGVAVARDLLAEMPLDSRQAIAVPLLSFGIGGGTIIGSSGIAEQLCVGVEVAPAQLSAGDSKRFSVPPIGSPIGVLEDLFARQARSVVGFFFPALTFLEPLFQPQLGLTSGVAGNVSPTARVKFQKLAIEAQQILDLRRVSHASDDGLSVSQ